MVVKSDGTAQISGKPVKLYVGASSSYAGVQFAGHTSERFKFTSDALTIGVNSNVRANLQVYGNSTVTGTKSRQVDTDNYSSRLLYAYETPSPMFGDLGSGTIGSDGLCYVGIDDVFSETVRVDIAYQVFLQKCGQGDLWVAEKHSTHFVVQGTPGLAFDWELKARQAGYSDLRLEDRSIDGELSPEYQYGDGIEDAYADDYGYIDYLEENAYEAA